MKVIFFLEISRKYDFYGGRDGTQEFSIMQFYI